MAVELDVGELGSIGAFVTEKPFLRLALFGNSGAMVGVWSSLKKVPEGGIEPPTKGL